jgi:hypothetical protein
MSSEAQPITPARFAAAVKDLPLPSLYNKAAELRNSIAHLQSSNEQLMPFSEAGDLECSEAILENVEVIKRMEERIQLLKLEVEGRGMRWTEHEEKQEGNADSEVVQDSTTNGQTAGEESQEGIREDQAASTTNGDGNSDERGVYL